MEQQCPACSASLPADGLSCTQCGTDVGWYIRKPDGQVYGPMDLNTLDRCINEARLTAGDEVRLGSTGDFVSAQERLGNRLTAPPPPVPVSAAYAGTAGAAATGASFFGPIGTSMGPLTLPPRPSLIVTVKASDRSASVTQSRAAA